MTIYLPRKEDEIVRGLLASEEFQFRYRSHPISCLTFRGLCGSLSLNFTFCKMGELPHGVMKILECREHLSSGDYFIFWRFPQYECSIVFFSLNCTFLWIEFKFWLSWATSYRSNCSQMRNLDLKQPNPQGILPRRNWLWLLKILFFFLEQRYPGEVAWHPRVSHVISRDIWKFSNYSQIKIIF